MSWRSGEVAAVHSKGLLAASTASDASRAPTCGLPLRYDDLKDRESNVQFYFYSGLSLL